MTSYKVGDLILIYDDVEVVTMVQPRTITTNTFWPNPIEQVEMCTDIFRAT